MNENKQVLLYVWRNAPKIQSDYVRENAQAVAAMACLGYVTTMEAPGIYGRRWRITAMGMEFLRLNKLP